MLERGERIGPYEVIELLGAGGMGEVYRARDGRLGREVAIKILSAAIATDASGLRRFEQEAQAAGRLNHPNVLAVFDVGRYDGHTYIVSELLEGETLRQRLDREKLPLRKAVDWATQIARGLAAAHDRGIVHRDLKPENIFVTRDGHTKIIDFGLAKLEEVEFSDAEATKLFHTRPGNILGTVGYMSPEQARGLPTDHRTDIFSFGAILFEMVAGRRAFQRNTPADTLSAILMEHPPSISESGQRVPSTLERIVAHCLEKDPHERFHSMRDVIFDLEGITTSSSSSAISLPWSGFSKRKRLQALAALALVGLITVAVLYGGTRAPGVSSQPPVGYERLSEFVGVEETPAISPDGKSVAFSAGGDEQHIWVRLLAGGPPLQITRDPVPHLEPRWSPDSASLIYFTPSHEATAEGTIYEIPALGGPARRLVPAITAGDISHDGKKLAYFRAVEDKVELTVADRDGRNPRSLAILPGNTMYSCIRWSPDDQSIAYQRGNVFNFDVDVVPASGGEPRALTSDRRDLQGFTWWPDGKGIVFSSARGHTLLYFPTFNLWSISLDGKRLRQLTFGETSHVRPDVDGEGRLVTTRIDSSFNIWKIPVNGSPAENVHSAVQITHQTGHVQTPSLSTNGRELVYLSDSGGHANLWVMKLDGSGDVRQITFERSPEVLIGVPVWSPAGEEITFFVRRVPREGQERAVDEQWLVSPDGSNLRRLTDLGGWASWSHDGRWLYTSPPVELGQPTSIFRIPVEGGTPVVVRSDQAQRPAPAPDGKTLYFAHFLGHVGGGSELELRVASPEDGPARLLARLPAWRTPVWQIAQPVLSPDGKFLALMLADAAATNIYALPTGGGDPRQITDFGQESTIIVRRVSWSSDSRHIYAAVGRTDGDIVMLRNLLPGPGQQTAPVVNSEEQ